ncbi:MAG: hypothetical protein ACRD4S_09435 [Candidatus Acidiferrales bacterium]
MRRLVVLAIFLSLFLVAGTASAATYYIDFSGGSDSNSGTSQSSPWKHAPGMNGCSANCASHTPGAGDSFIFKGGVTWDYTVWPWTLQGGGSSSSTSVGCNGGNAGGGCVYYGVDRSWFSGGSWERPIFSGGGWAAEDSSCHYDQAAPRHNMLIASGQKYWIIDNFEFTGMCSASGTNGGYFGQGSYIEMTNGSGSDHFDIENSYFHGWMFPSSLTPSRTSNPSAGDYTQCIVGASAGASNDEKHGEVHDNVFDGSDATNASILGDSSGEAMYGGPGTVFRNVFKDLPESLDPSDLITLHDNLFLNGNAVSISAGSNGAGTHEHLFNATFDECNDTIYNNVAITVASGEGFNPVVGSGCNEFIFNNVVTNVTMAIDGAGVNTFLIGSTGNGARYVFNNTCEGGPNGQGGPTTGCYRMGGGTTNLFNNHTISSLANGGIIQVDSGTVNQHNNVTQSLSSANGQGYSFDQSFEFSPTSGSGATVGAGTSQTNVCSMIPDSAASAACQDDTSYAVGYDTSNHTVIVPARTPQARSGNWDAGAYQFNGAGNQAPVPPTDIQISVQ